MSGALGDLTRLITVLQELVRASYLTQQTLSAGLAPTTLKQYTVAGLPGVAVAGQMAYALNGRNPAEGVGAGTGCAVVANGSGVWKAIWSGVAVVA
jgi:hypothetical protein